MSLFPEDAPRITRIAEDATGTWVSVLAGRRRLAKVPASRFAALDIEVGTPWTPELAARALRVAETSRAKRKAIALLKIKQRSSRELQGRLTAAGFSTEASDAAIAELRQTRAVDDEALAAHLIERQQAKGFSGHAINENLKTRGLSLPGTPSPDESNDAAPTPSDAARALAAARNRLTKVPESLPAAAKFRRLASALTRLGYEEDTAREAARQALGVTDDPGDSHETGD